MSSGPAPALAQALKLKAAREKYNMKTTKRRAEQAAHVLELVGPCEAIDPMNLYHDNFPSITLSRYRRACCLRGLLGAVDVILLMIWLHLKAR